MYYRIGERIEEFEPTTFENIPFQYVAVIGSGEWIDSNRKFDMGIEWDDGRTVLLKSCRMQEYKPCYTKRS